MRCRRNWRHSRRGAESAREYVNPVFLAKRGTRENPKTPVLAGEGALTVEGDVVSLKLAETEHSKLDDWEER